MLGNYVGVELCLAKANFVGQLVLRVHALMIPNDFCLHIP